MINILMSRSDLIHPKIKPALTPYIKKGMKVTVVCYSFFDSQYPRIEDYRRDYGKDGKYYIKVVEQLIPFGIKEEDIAWASYFDDTESEAIKKIETSDILFFPGGAPDKFMERIHEKGLYETINNYKKTYIGVSAGTMIQFNRYHISPDIDYHKFSYQDGLDLLKGFFVEVHYRRRKKQKSGMRKVFRTYKKPIYIIPDDGAVVIDDTKILTIHTAKKYYENRGVIK